VVKILGLQQIHQYDVGELPLMEDKNVGNVHKIAIIYLVVIIDIKAVV
tara:strand:+ start:2953 stop:3096 length:144 start_codon:yes stop_codon:yes gene_type:complete